MDKDELERLSKQAERHKLFVHDNECYEIDGIPKKIRDTDDPDDAERQIKKLERVANDNDDWELKNIVRKMKHSL